VAAFEQTHLAEAIERRIDNPHVWYFIERLATTFIFRIFQRAIEAVTNYLCPPGTTGFERNVLQMPPQDIEALPREFFPNPRREPSKVLTTENATEK
jgi:hypothetical protein